MRSEKDKKESFRGERSHINFSILRNKRFFLSNLASMIDSFANASLFIFIPFLFASHGLDSALIGTFTSVFFVGNLAGKVIMGRLADGRNKAGVLKYA